MPVYEFYCPDCHVIFNFLAKRVNTEKRPACPRCTRPELERQVSLFAISKGRKESEDDDGMPDLDESKMEQAMMAMASQAEHLDENNPREMGAFMRRMTEVAGMPRDAAMEEAIRRMEAGEDPDAIEEEMGDLLEDEDPFGGEGAKKGLKGLRRRYLRPEVDETLYEL
jgi:putative FmdB family regulatory protein